MFNSRGNKKGASAVPGRRRPLVAPGGQGLSRLEASRHARVFSQLLDLIGASQKICLIGHAAPDGDSLMSCLALKTYLASQGKEADMVLDGQIPYNYDRYADSGLFLVRDHIGPYDLALALDSATPERLGRFKKLFMAARFKIVLDHHSTNSGFGNVNIIDSQVSSTCELIYHLLDFANYRLNKQIAEFLYIGILTDTGRFRYPAANGRTHRVVGALMDHGLKPDEIYGDIFRNKPAGLAQACGAAMAGLRLFAEGRAALAKITARTAELNNGRIDEIDGIIDWLMDIRGVRLACVLKETGELTKVSLRSIRGYDLRELAERYHGGGHPNAAGFILPQPVIAAEKLLIAALADFIARHI